MIDDLHLTDETFASQKLVPLSATGIVDLLNDHLDTLETLCRRNTKFKGQKVARAGYGILIEDLRGCTTRLSYPICIPARLLIMARSNTRRGL
jgi:hypothetical protein